MNNTRIETPRAAFGKLLLNESRLALRIPTGLVAGLGLPLLLLIVFRIIPDTTQPQRDFGGYSYLTLTFPILVALTVMVLSIMTLPRSLISYRQTGILRRLSVTPVPPWWLLAAQVVINLAIAVAGLVILLVVGVAALSLDPPKNLLGFLVAYVLTMASLFALGLCMAAFVPNDAVAQVIGGILFFGLLFFGGLWIPRPLMPAELITISNATPLGASVAALQNAMEGVFPTLQSLLVLAAYTVVLGYLAARWFRWE
jgi:ABC-2 type transport system permease protein